MREFITHKSKGKKTVIFVITILFLIYLAFPALASTIQELEKQKEASQQKINLLQYNVDQDQRTIEGIEREIINSNEAIASLQGEISILNDQINSINNQIVKTQAELEEAQHQEQEQSDLINERLRVQYMYGDNGYTEALFDGDSITQQLENSAIVADILKADQELLDQITENKNKIAETKVLLENQRAEFNSKKAQLDENLRAQNNIKAQQQALLNKNIELINQKKAEIAQEQAVIASANEEIKALTKEAEEKAKSETVTQVKNVTEKAKAFQTQINQNSTETKKVLEQTQSSEVQNIVSQIEIIESNSNKQNEQIATILEEVKEAETAAEAVEKSEQLEYIITILSDNDNSVKELKQQAKEIELEIKEEEIAAAQEQVELEQSDEAKETLETVIEEKEVIAEELEEAKEAVIESSSAVEIIEEPVKAYSSWEDDNISSSGWRWPLDGNHDITSLYGYRIHPIFGVGMGHEGIDVGASTGTPIHACDGGIVISSGVNGGYGNCVIVQQDSGHQVYYAHQSTIAVSKGQRVEKGDVVGYVGSTGWSTGPHLHLGVLSGGSFVDPFYFFPELN